MTNRSETGFTLLAAEESRERIGQNYMNYETEFVIFLGVLENSVLPMGLDSSHTTLKVTSEF